MLLRVSGMCHGPPGELIEGRLMIDMNAGNLGNCGIHLLTNISSVFFLHVFCIFPCYQSHYDDTSQMIIPSTIQKKKTF